MGSQDNTVAITTRSVMYDGAVVIRVILDSEGYWQFLPGSALDEAEAMVVSVQQVLNGDPTLQELMTLPYGSLATRTGRDENWSNQPFVEDD